MSTLSKVKSVPLIQTRLRGVLLFGTGPGGTRMRPSLGPGGREIAFEFASRKEVKPKVALFRTVWSERELIGIEIVPKDRRVGLALSTALTNRVGSDPAVIGRGRMRSMRFPGRVEITPEQLG